MPVCVYFISAVVLNQDRDKILYLARFHKDHTLLLRQLLACFNGIVDPVAEKGADVKRLNEIHTAKIYKSRKVDLLFTGFLRLIPDNNVKKIVTRVDIVFIVRNLRTNLLRHPICERSSCAICRVASVP